MTCSYTSTRSAEPPFATGLPSGLSGIGDAPVRVLVADRLAAVVSSVDPLDFGAEPLRRNLEDLSWLASTARAHHAVVDAVWRREPVAPLRLATVYVDDDNVRAMLHSREAAFLALLDRVRGRQEWGVKAFAVQDGPRGRTGRGRRRQEARARGGLPATEAWDARPDRSRHQGKVQDDVEELHRELAGWRPGTAAATCCRTRGCRATRADIALNAAYLVERRRRPGFPVRSTIGGRRTCRSS